MQPDAADDDGHRPLLPTSITGVAPPEHMMAVPTAGLAKPREFYLKSGLLLASTIALVPIMLLKDELWAKVYLVVLILLHLAGPFIVFWGMKPENWKRMWYGNRRTFWYRILSIAALLSLLALASRGLSGHKSLTSGIFWASLFGIWGLHTGALALLHIRGKATNTSCPFA
jgi:hypothetical protein